VIVLYVFLAVLAFLIIFALTAKIKIFFEYKKYPGEKLYIDYKITLDGISLNSVIKKQTAKKTKEKPKDKKGIIQKLKDLAKVISIVTKVYSKNRWFIQKRLTAEDISFHLKFGLADAASTGIATGAIWAVLYNILALISRIGTLKNHNFEVVPVYTEEGFISEGGFKLSFRLAGIISVALRLYLTYKKLTKNKL
jgi:hypothetical protein